MGSGIDSFAPTTSSKGRPVSRRLRLLCILAVIGIPLVWAVVALRAGPSDGTLSYPVATVDEAARWGSGHPPGAPVRTTYGDGGLQLVGLMEFDQAGRGIRVAAVGRSSDQHLVDMQEWARNPRPGLWHAGDLLRYEIADEGTSAFIDVQLETYPLLPALLGNIRVLPLYLALTGAAAVAVWRRPRDRAVHAFVAIVVLLSCGMTVYPFGVQVIDLAGGRGLWPQLVGGGCTALAWGAALLLALLFPSPATGLARRPWLSVLTLLLPVGVYAAWAGTVASRATSPLERLEALANVSEPVALVCAPLLAAVLVWSYRRARFRDRRMGLRLVVAAAWVALALYVGLGVIPTAMMGEGLVDPSTVSLLVLVPFALLAVVVVKYGLLDVPAFVRRPLLAAASGVTAAVAFLVAIFLAEVLVQAMSWTEPFPEERLVFMMVGGLVAVALVPLARLGRRLLGRLAYGDREAPYRVVSHLRGLETATSPDGLRLTVQTLARTLRLAYAHLEVTWTGAPQSDGPFVVTIGSSTRPPTEVILRMGQERIGRLLLDTHPALEPFGKRDAQLLDDIGTQVGAAVQAVALNQQLRRSRERIISAREEERRRVRRDLHDGLGPALATQAMQLEVARDLVRADPGAAEELLGTLADGTRADIAEIRRLVDELRPPILDQLGLVSALRQRASSFNVSSLADAEGERAPGTLRWTVHGADVEPLPAAVEVAAYRIVLEAVNNAAKHANARTCHVELARGPAGLLVTVADDGDGLAEYRRVDGLGMASMAERAEELGGTFEVSTGSAGTTVRARLPIGTDLKEPT